MVSSSHCRSLYTAIVKAVGGSVLLKIYYYFPENNSKNGKHNYVLKIMPVKNNACYNNYMVRRIYSEQDL